MSCSPSITYIISISHTIYMKYCYLAHSPGVSNNYKVIAFSLNRFLNVSQKKTNIKSLPKRPCRLRPDGRITMNHHIRLLFVLVKNNVESAPFVVKSIKEQLQR